MNTNTPIMRHIGLGIAPPKPVIKIKNTMLFNLCMVARAKKDTRAYLNGICIDPVKKTLTGSNGAIFFRGDALEFDSYLGKNKIIINPDKKLPKGCDYAEILIDKEIIECYREGRKIRTITFDIIDASYPDISPEDEIIEENKVMSSKLGVNSKLVWRLQKQASANYPRTVLIQPYKRTKSTMPDVCFYRITFDMPLPGDYLAIVMPIINRY